MSNQPEHLLPPLVSGAAHRGRVLRVLVVEDYRDAAQSLAMLLQLWGHAVCVAVDGPTALPAGSSCQPDVVLLDLGLPGMDGYEVARRLRGMGSRRPALWAMTGFGDTECQRRCRDAGFDRHLLKPVDPEVLEMLLAQHEWLAEQDAAPVPGGSVPSAA